jgi:hypothetical protein
VFANSGDLCALAGNQIYNGLWIWFYTSMGQCYLYPHDANHLMVIEDGQFEIRFDSPVSRFGGWFSRGLDLSTPIETFEFFDAQGTLIHTQAIAVTVRLPMGVVRLERRQYSDQQIRINGAAPVGHAIVIDDLQATSFRRRRSCTAPRARLRMDASHRSRPAAIRTSHTRRRVRSGSVASMGKGAASCSTHSAPRRRRGAARVDRASCA